MKHVSQITFAERAGRMLGQCWRALVRADRKAHRLLVGQGWAPGLTMVALSAVKLVAIGVLVYTVFWLALLFAFALAAAWAVRNDDGSYDAEHHSEWRYGPAGYGLYSYDGYRIDPHDDEREA